MTFRNQYIAQTRNCEYYQTFKRVTLFQEHWQKCTQIFFFFLLNIVSFCIKYLLNSFENYTVILHNDVVYLGSIVLTMFLHQSQTFEPIEITITNTNRYFFSFLCHVVSFFFAWIHISLSACTKGLALISVVLPQTREIFLVTVIFCAGWDCSYVSNFCQITFKSQIFKPVEHKLLLFSCFCVL